MKRTYEETNSIKKKKFELQQQFNSTHKCIHGAHTTDILLSFVIKRGFLSSICLAWSGAKAFATDRGSFEVAYRCTDNYPKVFYLFGRGHRKEQARRPGFIV